MSFKAYVRVQPRGSSPHDDFIDHARRDTAMPDARCWRELKDYLVLWGACPGAVDSARIVWQRYCRSARSLGAATPVKARDVVALSNPTSPLTASEPRRH